jgi:hypothetical protein
MNRIQSTTPVLSTRPGSPEDTANTASPSRHMVTRSMAAMAARLARDDDALRGISATRETSSHEERGEKRKRSQDTSSTPGDMRDDLNNLTVEARASEQHDRPAAEVNSTHESTGHNTRTRKRRRVEETNGESTSLNPETAHSPSSSGASGHDNSIQRSTPSHR